MLLIIFLSLIAKLTLVSGDCDLGTLGMDDFDFTKASGDWYVHFHSPNDYENKFDCVVVYYGSPDGNKASASIHAHLISENTNTAIDGNITNWNSTGLQQNYSPPSIWDGWYKAIAVDYKRYKILKHCSKETNLTYVYVSYRTPHPDEDTVKEVKKVLQKNNIDVSKLVKWRTHHCQKGKSSEE